MNEIEYPKRESEAEIQSLLWVALKEKGLDTRLEVGAELNGRRHRLDIVVFWGNEAQAIIECKSWSRRYNKERLYQLTKNTKQIRKYEDWGLPVFVCGRLETIPKVVELVLASYHNREFHHI